MKLKTLPPQLWELTGLEKLDLSYTEITDAGLGNLQGLEKLIDLDLQKTKVADAGVNLDLVYVATMNRVVFGAADLEGLRAALT